MPRRAHHRLYDDALFALDDPVFWNRLPPRVREVLLYRRIGLKVEEIADRMGITWRTVWGYRVQAWRMFVAYRREEAERAHGLGEAD